MDNIKNTYQVFIASSLRVGERSVDTTWLQHLPQLWKKIKVNDSRVWCPDKSIVFAMLKNYDQIANGNGEEAEIARQYILQVKEAMKEAIPVTLDRPGGDKIKLHLT